MSICIELEATSPFIALIEEESEKPKPHNLSEAWSLEVNGARDQVRAQATPASLNPASNHLSRSPRCSSEAED
jgi:hypothetical protein